MVFSIFKKTPPPNTMPKRPAATPRPMALRDPATPSRFPRPSGPESRPPQGLAADADDLDFTHHADGDSLAVAEEGLGVEVEGIQVEHDVDPIAVYLEQAAILYANGQDASARTTLQTAVRRSLGPEAEPLWRMLLDLLQLQGDHLAFEKMGLVFAQHFETSPPAWRSSDSEVRQDDSGSLQLVLRGVVVGQSAELRRLGEAVDKHQNISLDCGQLISLDSEACRLLSDLLQKARRGAAGIGLVDVETLIGRLEKRAVAGSAEDGPSWLLLLELYQLLGRQEDFENKAVDYAVTFEVSPPSWEATGKLVVQVQQSAQAAAGDEFYVLQGEFRNARFPELQDFIDHCHLPQVIVDCSALQRLDFASAGTLVQLLAPYHRQGREFQFRHPNRLVAALLHLVGLEEFARIVFAKN
ncbi:MAG: hypothetical protein RIR00_1325 [Pseudomonadota bacterium]|jgi:anti-anti-sigma regulatory factor